MKSDADNVETVGKSGNVEEIDGQRFPSMRFLLKYFGQYKIFIIVFFFIAFFFTLSFYLYHLPVEAVIYPSVVCLVFLVIILAAKSLGAGKRHQYLRHVKNLLPDIPEDLAGDSILEEDYLALLRSLSDSFAKLQNEKDIRYANMQEYYSLWVHQIKTPIASMKLTLQNENSALASRLLSDLKRIELYVEMVLTYVRLESETTDYVIREYDLDDIIKATLRTFSGDFITKRLKLDYTETGAKIITDEKWFGFVLGQVLSNALKYTSEGTISVYLDNGDTLCVRDTGIGIDAEDLPRVFECSFTGGNGRRMGSVTGGNDYTGGGSVSSGIGLYLCRRICRNLNHYIRIESCPNKGTTVKIGISRESERLE